MLSSGLSFKGKNKIAKENYIKRLENVSSIGKLTDYDFLDNYNIYTEGDEDVKIINDWSIFPEYIQNILRQEEFTKPTPIQKYSFSCYKANRPLIALSPTGSGKTLAYVLPLLEILKDEDYKVAKALVLAPTRELATQIHRQFRKFCDDHNRAQYLQKHRKFPKAQIIIATPKRVLMFKDKLSTVKYLVLDEADQLLSMSFVKQADEVLSSLPENFHTSIYSATITPKVEETARSFMKNPVRIQIGERNEVPPNIKQRLIFVGNEKGKVTELRTCLLSESLRLPAIIFLDNYKRAMDLRAEIKIPSVVLTSEKNDSERSEALKKFRSGEVKVLLTTDLGCRGIDLITIKTVINFDIPKTAYYYIHRIGRTARAGRSGEAITFYTEGDIPYLKPIANILKGCGYDDQVKDFMFGPVPSDKRGARLLYEPSKRNTISSKLWKNSKAKPLKRKYEMPASMEE